MGFHYLLFTGSGDFLEFEWDFTKSNHDGTVGFKGTSQANIVSQWDMHGKYDGKSNCSPEGLTIPIPF